MSCGCIKRGNTINNALQDISVQPSQHCQRVLQVTGLKENFAGSTQINPAIQSHLNPLCLISLNPDIHFLYGSSHARVLIDPFNCKPMPPAPTSPRMVDSRMLISQRKMPTPAKVGRTCGTMP